MNLSILAAKAENNVIGKDNRLIWHLPADLKHFRELTTGSTVIMGRKTFESIGKALPSRENIIITRQEDYDAPGCEVVHSLEEAVQISSQEENVFIIGGGEIYRQAMGIAGTLYITEIHQQFPGDAFFPEIDEQVWEETFREDHPSNEKNPFDFSFVTYQRKNN
ncbi:dihydrofolate reductase [Anseongella ginsenosidimutans]|uniref:Dihydrofolate reductase n=1 Tax=Anseongella ginsenosidimutans TaxID=496056 RepID=A0A4R3KRS8_9SPHI|nr:dihydrofolate reductase [Anseongella ginsenosidimutans]QEC53116.1 dihydrofolate reductase [Anseongella ginsenosidimutans]TCS87734.1 dihydrofolate reductase [Anseongella ginsenosidimutans]